MRAHHKILPYGKWVLRIILGPKRGEWRKLHYEEA
jgi:hypothetical protein